MATILIIDDTPFWRELQEDALAPPKGYEVITAGDGLAGLEKLAQHKIDLIILDVDMPKLEGFGFLERIRNRREWQNIPVIMLTGANAEEKTSLRAASAWARQIICSRVDFHRTLCSNALSRRLNGPTAAAGGYASAASLPGASSREQAPGGDCHRAQPPTGPKGHGCSRASKLCARGKKHWRAGSCPASSPM